MIDLQKPIRRKSDGKMISMTQFFAELEKLYENYPADRNQNFQAERREDIRIHFGLHVAPVPYAVATPDEIFALCSDEQTAEFVKDCIKYALSYSPKLEAAFKTIPIIKVGGE